MRRALQLSLNVPAVAVLDEVGPSRLIARLAEAGAPLVLPRREAPGLALGLGGVGVRLTDLTMLYAGLARQGTVAPLNERLGAPPLPPKRLIEPVAAWYVANVLLGSPPPENAAGGRIAFKTGTSYGYRDAWAIGFDGKHTIGVWTGRPDGAPVAGLVGRVSAAPILFDAFARLGQSLQPLKAAPKGALIATTAKLPPPLQRFASRASAGEAMAPKVHIVFPPNGASLELAGVDRREAGPDRHQDRRRHPSPQRAAQRHAACRQEVGADPVLRPRRAGLRAADGDRRDGRRRQRHRAPAIVAVAGPSLKSLAVPVGIEPMEAKLVTELPEEPGWQFEPKWDGFRCLAFRAGREVDLRAKSGKPLARYFPEVVAMLAALKPSPFVIDGELAIPVGGTLSFDALQMRIHPAESRIKKLAAETPAILILFDMLLDTKGNSLIEAPLSEATRGARALLQGSGPSRGTEALALHVGA